MNSPTNLDAHDVRRNERQAALLLHAMPREDRAWVLDQLAGPVRSVLESLLAELHALGIPADRGLLHQLAPDRDPRLDVPGPNAGARDESIDEAAVRRASPTVLAKLLAHEPAELTARLLMLRDWPWEAVLLEQLGDARRREVHVRRMRCTEAGAAARAPAANHPQRDGFDRQLLSLLHAELTER